MDSKQTKVVMKIQTCLYIEKLVKKNSQSKVSQKEIEDFGK
jgi:hypothetical protein